MPERIKLLPRYLINLGLFVGLYVFLQVELFGFARVQVPGYKFPVFLRRGTTDRKVFREIFLFRIYSIPSLSNIRTIIDAGANIGLSSIYFAHRFPDAFIIAIEPDPGNVEILKMNISGYPNIKLLASALWSTETFLYIVNINADQWAFVVEPCSSDTPGSFKGISIKDVMKTFNLREIDLLKLDIEGSEKELFERKTDEWIPKIRFILVELHDWLNPGSSRSFFSAISTYKISTEFHQGMVLVKNNKE